MNRRIVETASAKINLFLHVLAKRSDGYHQIESLVTFARVSDQIAVRQNSLVSANENKLRIDGPFAHNVGPEKSNLVLRALDLFRARWPDKISSGLEIKLSKNLPVSAGIGGGSADAAAMLRILCNLGGISPKNRDILDICAQLGADVPVCLERQTRIMGGIGEVLGPEIKLPIGHIVLINPGIPVSTADSFSWLEINENTATPPLPAYFTNMGHLVDWLKSTRNDLQQLACIQVPEIAEIIEFMSIQKQCLLTRMSGSGATVFALFSDRGNAQTASTIAQQNWPDYWISATELVGS